MPKLDDFEGHWRISRRIEDARAGETGLFEGEGLFTRSGADMLYDEKGTLTLPGRSFAAERSYIWREDDGGIAVLYDDGRPFHRIGAGDVVRDWHDCLPDLYEATYNFTHWPDWRVIWKVTGPRKDYVSITDYRRAGHSQK